MSRARSRATTRGAIGPFEIYSPQDYKDLHPGNENNIVDQLPIVLTDTSEYEPGVDEYGMPVYWSKITEEHYVAPILDIGTFNYQSSWHDA